MSVAGVNISSATTRLPEARLAGGDGSSAVPGQSFATALRGARQDDHAAMRDAAQKLVTDAFVKPALATLRESPFLQSGPFAPGPGERRFMPMLDELMADRITRAANFPLVDAVARHISNIAGVAPEAGQREAGESEKRYG